jgi:hypothetical protein
MKSMPNILKWSLAAVLVGFAATSPAAALEPLAAETAMGPAAKAGQQNVDAEHAQAPMAVAPDALPAAATTSHMIELPGRSLRFKAIARASPPMPISPPRPSFLRASSPPSARSHSRSMAGPAPPPPGSISAP